MKGVLKKVGGFFYETEDKPIKKVPIVVPTQVVQQMVQPLGSDSSPDYHEFRAQFTNILADENKRNYPGNDYYEFIVMKNAILGISQDLRYQAAFAGWSTGGNQTKDSLVNTAKIYLGLVDKEIKDFEEAYKLQYAQQVTKNEQVIEQKTKRVQALLEEMNQLNSDINQLKQENLANTANLTQKHDAFMTAGQAQRQEILDEVDKINHYIK